MALRAEDKEERDGETGSQEEPVTQSTHQRSCKRSRTQSGDGETEEEGAIAGNPLPGHPKESDGNQTSWIYGAEQPKKNTRVNKQLEE